MAEIADRLTNALADRYHLERELGAGGMATVYLATDLKHHRKVALKVLRPELAAMIGAERFLKEIEVTANLQHPHILPLHDSGEADHFLYYVMPYVEGETLRDLLRHDKQLPIDQAIEITRAVASALDYAHRHGVIHRDIKPENVLIHDGQALVADFGIALAVSQAGGSRLTETGLSLGTPHYMSPEQAMGDRELDARSDVYSLGAMLFEMLAGDPPYTGSTAQAIVAKVITEKPPLVTAARDTVPTHVALAINKALAKLPADRFSTAAAFSEALVRPGMVETGDQALQTTVARPATRPERRGWLVTGAIAVGTLLLGVAAGWVFHSTPSAPLARFTLALPAGQNVLPDIDATSLAISPDGRQLVYIGPAENGGGTRLYLRPVDQLEATPLSDTDGGINPFFSPDGKWLGFAAGGNLRRVALAGGAAITITRSTNSRGAAWGKGDLIVFNTSNTTGLSTIPAGGGDPATLTVLDTAHQEVSHRWPEMLPSGDGVVFTVWRGPGAGAPVAEVAVVSLKTKEVKRLFPGVHARYVAPGYLVYCTLEGALLAVPFDAGRLEVTGTPVSLLQGLLAKPSSANAEFAISETGTLTYLSGNFTPATLVLVDRSGREEVLPTGVLAAPEGPRFSPDGRRIALDMSGQEASNANLSVWVYTLASGTLTRLTFEGEGRYPEWAPDGRHISFAVNQRTLEWKPWDGSGDAARLLNSAKPVFEGVFTPDGRTLMVRVVDADSGGDLITVRTGDSVTTPYLTTRFNERSPRFSPDGRWVAYTSNESGRDEVYVRAFPGPGGRWQVSDGGGAEPVWSRDGREVFYRVGSQFIAVPVQTSPAFTLGLRKVLFSAEYAANLNHPAYDVQPDGRRFLVVKPGEGRAGLIVMLNWFGELRQRMGK